MIGWLANIFGIAYLHQLDSGQNHGFSYFREDTGPESRCLNPNCEFKMLSFSLGSRQDKFSLELK